MCPWTDSSTWEESVRHLEESMNEELIRVLSNVEESIPDASYASPDASHALPDTSHASRRIPCLPDASHASRRIPCLPDVSHALPDASHAPPPTHPMWRSRPRTHERDIFVKNVGQMTFS
ncbi:hypothetical protein Hanom_Chr10g00889191 [Helianthus anomalus]